MDALGNALAELANELNVTTGELWGWLTNTGMESYVRVQVMRHAFAFVFFFIAAVGFAVVAWRFFKRNREPTRDTMGDRSIAAILGICCCAALVFVFCAVSQAVMWAMAPEGMVVEMFVDMLT